ncbi:MAG: hypothetical protein GKR92_08190 [Gammaproteobacteria bacterium]|nr:MAG: hypothetical protein GKR92_08190 [Gammaproteobacteria bacterium]
MTKILCKLIQIIKHKNGGIMNSFSYIRILLIISIITLFINITSANELDFSDEAVAKEIIEGNWTCSHWDKYGSGETYWNFKKVTGRKVAGENHYGYCPSEKGTVKGKLKKNNMRINVKRPLPCSDLTGVLTFQASDDGLHTAEGIVVLTNHERTRGTLKCVKANVRDKGLLSE